MKRASLDPVKFAEVARAGLRAARAYPAASLELAKSYGLVR